MEEFEVLQFYFTQEYKFQVLPQKVTSFGKSNLLNKFYVLSHLSWGSKCAPGVQENVCRKEVIEMKVPPHGELSFKSLKNAVGRLGAIFTNSN